MELVRAQGDCSFPSSNGITACYGRIAPTTFLRPIVALTVPQGVPRRQVLESLRSLRQVAKLAEVTVGNASAPFAILVR
jgi:hypothetical protein